MLKRPNICDYKETYESECIDFSCDPFFNDQRLIAEGGSWLTVGGLRCQNPWFSNILFNLRFHEETLILNLAAPGDTLKRISATPMDIPLKLAVEEHPNDPWDAIILSAGGNDLIDNLNTLFLNKLERQDTPINSPADYCNTMTVDRFLQNIENNYRRLAAVRGNHAIPIVTHTYDYPTPRDAPSLYFGIGLFGPWIYPCMINAEIPKNQWGKVIDYLLDQLAERILSLTTGQNKIPDFHVIDTRNTLVRAQLNSKGEDGDWLNEIHPNQNGYKKIARLIEQKLRMVAGIY